MTKYINKLTDKEIEEFFNTNGYALVKDLTDDDGLPIDAIERGDDSIFVRVQQLRRDDIDIEFEKLLMQKAPGLMALSTLASMHSSYGRNIDLVYFSDYFMSKFCITEEDKNSSQELYTSYVRYMAQKFPTYKADFLEHCDTLSKDKPQAQDEQTQTM